MKVLVTCVTCMKEASERFRTNGTSIPVQVLSAEMDDAGVVYVSCNNGHKTAMLHRNRKHQILFESGCLALLDHYTNEAVSSFSAALERTYEFFIRVAYRKLGVSSVLLESSWKEVASLSERQFGAFVLLYPVITCESFGLPQKIPKLRNKVIHRGYIARSDEVFQYAETVFSLIRKIVQALNDKCSVEMWAEINEAAEVQRKAVRPGMEWAWTLRTEFDLIQDLTFESWLNELKEQRRG
jgi:hypothetical protein